MIESTPETEPFWSALADGRLVVSKCMACGTIQPTPRAICLCGGTARAWIDLPGRAKLASFTTVSFAPSDRPYLPSPYTLGVVDFDDPEHRMMALIDPGGGHLAVGQAVTFQPFRAGDLTLPQFVPDQTGGPA